MIDRSVYTAIATLFINRPRALALSRAEVQRRIFDLCKIEVHVRDLQWIIDEVAKQEEWFIISEARGYWRLDENASEADVKAAEHSVNTLRAHGQAEIEKANVRELWIEAIRERQAMRTQERQSNRQQERLFV